MFIHNNQVLCIMDFIQDIEENGGKVYLVGGCVRDRCFNLLFKTNIKPKDYDILVLKLTIESLGNILKNHGSVKEVGKAFGILTFKPNPKYGIDTELELALPRTERSIGTGYRDFEIISDPNITINEDLMRRDTTINAMAYQLHEVKDLFSEVVDIHKIVDPTGGFEDLKKKTIRAATYKGT